MNGVVRIPHPAARTGTEAGRRAGSGKTVGSMDPRRRRQTVHQCPCLQVIHAVVFDAPWHSNSAYAEL